MSHPPIAGVIWRVAPIAFPSTTTHQFQLVPTPRARRAPDMPDPVAGTPAAAPVTPEAAMAAIAAMRAEIRELDKVTDKSGKERHILDRNFKLRRKNAELEFENSQLKAAKPKDGAVMLSKEDAADYEAFKKLNVKPADLTTLIKEHGELKATVEARTAEEQFADAAEALGLANLPLFVRTMTREGLHLEFKDVQVRDEDSGRMVTVKVPMVRPKADDKAALVPLETYLDDELGPEFIAALQSEPPRDGEEGDDGDEGEDRTDRTARGTESFTRTAARLGEGDAGARRSAATAAARSRSSSGVPIPVTRGARPATGRASQEKRDREAIDEKARSSIYSAL